MISKNFLVLGSELPVQRALGLVSKLQPEYVILVRREGGREYRYVFLAASLLEAYLRFTPAHTLTMKEFLRLHEPDQDRVVDIHEASFGQDDVEAVLGKPVGRDMAIVTSRGRARAVVDPQAGDRAAVYHLRGLNFAFRQGPAGRPAEAGAAPHPPPPPIFGPPGLGRRRARGERRTRGAPERLGRGPLTSERRPPALEPKEVLERYPHATFPEKVAVGQEEKLEVIIRAQRRAEEGPSIRVLATPEEREVPVLVLVKPGSFEIRGEDRQEIRLPVESRDSKTATFRLVAREKGRQAIRVLFFPRGVYAAEIEVKTNVVSKAAEASGAARPSVRSEAPISEIPPSADLTMIISEEKRDPGLVYDVCLYSPRLGLIWGKFGKVGLSTDPESKFREIFRDMEDDSLPAAVIERNVIAKGKSLYSELFPQELKEEYWRIRDRIDSIVVVTEEPWIPWEILKPYRGTDGGFQDDPFLCERYSFTRWLTGPTYRPKARIERAKIVVPTDTDLWNVIPERDWIEAFGRQKDFQVTFASELEEVLESLKRGEFDLLHFSSHGRFDPTYPNTSGVTLQGGIELRPEHLTGLADLAKTNPLVILNACQTGSQGFSLTRIGGWASAFLNAHASGFLGTQWSISDVVAFAFTKEFYQRLAQGTPLGKAVQQARTACLRPGDPSALAYQLYAYPNSIMKLGT